MRTAYVMINCDLGQEHHVLEELKSMIPVTEVKETVGAYDIVAKMESDSEEKIRHTVRNKVQTLKSVRSTLTLLAC